MNSSKRTIKVSNLPKSTSDESLRSVFEPFGLIKTVEIPLHPITSKIRPKPPNHSH